jgi:hypothetical protein
MADVFRNYYVLQDIPELKVKAGHIISLTEARASEFSDRQLQLFHVAHRNGLVGEGGPIKQEPAPPLYTGTSLRDWDKKMEARKKAVEDIKNRGKKKR